MDHDASARLGSMHFELKNCSGIRIDDRIDLAKMSREHSVRIGMGHGQQAEPFFVSMVLSWTWSPVHAARTYTNEEDLLSGLLGRKQAQGLITKPPWLRLDVKLCANMPYGKPLQLKGAKSLQGWTDKVTRDLEPFLRTRVEATRKVEAIHAHLGGPEARMQCDGAGELVLLAVELEAWRAITLPRESYARRADHCGRDGNLVAALRQRCARSILGMVRQFGRPARLEICDPDECRRDVKARIERCYLTDTPFAL